MTTPSPISRITHPIFEQLMLNVFVKRDDLIHPIISGNKWRKLKYNLVLAEKLGKKGILSFGGAYSNHIHALSYACKIKNLQSIGLIRGESHYQSNATLSQAIKWGMDCKFVDRSTYKRRYDNDYLAQLSNEYPDYYIVPEGGTNQIALQGVKEIITELNEQLDFDTIITPVGSAGTISGLITGDYNQHQIIGINVLKGAKYLDNEVKQLIRNSDCNSENWQIFHDYHIGGYAKFSKEDALKILAFNQQTGVTFEPIYSGKMLLGFLDLIEKGFFKAGQRIVLLHTGGLQGINGLIERNKLSSSQWPLQPEQ